jgi:integrase
VGLEAEGEAGQRGDVTAPEGRQGGDRRLPEIGPQAEGRAAHGRARQLRLQPHTNYRTLDFEKPLSSRQAHKIVRRWGEYAGVGRVSPHDLRRTVITKLLNDGRSYREVQMVTKSES